MSSALMKTDNISSSTTTEQVVPVMRMVIKFGPDYESRSDLKQKNIHLTRIERLRALYRNAREVIGLSVGFTSGAWYRAKGPYLVSKCCLLASQGYQPEIWVDWRAGPEDRIRLHCVLNTKGEGTHGG